DTGIKPLNESYGPGNVKSRNVGVVESHRMRIHNGRPLAAQFALERNGFAFVEHETLVADFLDRARLPETYYPEVRELVARISGAGRVVVFDHTLRSGDDTEREAKLVQEPVLLVHNDYTEWSGPQRVRDVLPDEAEALLAHRFAIIQVWRPIREVVQSNPLAVSDARTVSARDLIASERRYPDRIGEVYRVS